MRLENYVEEQLNQFYHNLIKAIENTDSVAIHDLRVVLKRLFALNKVVDIFFPDLSSFYKDSLEKTHCVFKQAGVIRDNQVMSKLALQWLSEEEYIKFIDFISSKMSSSKEKLNRLYPDVNIEVICNEFCWSFERISSDYMCEFRNHLLAYVENNGKKISESVQSEKCDFHAVRRWVKEQYYIQIQLNEVMGLNINKEILNKKNQHGKLLGKWHDLKVFEKQLKKSGCNVDKLLYDNIISMQKSLIKETGMV